MVEVVWTIAGSDNCSGAGIQADLKTFTAFGVHGCTVIAALTAQNTFDVSAAESVSVKMLAAQIKTLQQDMPPKAIKIGMLGDSEGVLLLADKLGEIDGYVVYDPVMIASAGAKLMGDDVLPVIKESLFPQVDLLTPNIAEAETLAGYKFKNDADIERAAKDILALGVKAIFIKGWNSGHGFVQDYYCSASQKFWLTSQERKIPGARGTGCTLASVCAAAHALGFSEADAVVMAKLYVNQAQRLSRNIGKGAPILAHDPLSPISADFPWLTMNAAAGRKRPLFPDCGSEPLGFYPVVDSLDWLKRLLPLGVNTAQLRIKDKEGAVLEEEISAAINLARIHNCRLFINDYWEYAIKHKAYGVHLGQEDLDTADIAAIEKSGLRLGLSTHCYSEVSRAVGLNPSYMAIGPVFPTTLKSMKFAPQGVEALRRWRQMLTGPLVAIGGITLEVAATLFDAGADGIAVVSDVTRNADPDKRAAAWIENAASRKRNLCEETTGSSPSVYKRVNLSRTS